MVTSGAEISISAVKPSWANFSGITFFCKENRLSEEVRENRWLGGIVVAFLRNVLIEEMALLGCSHLRLERVDNEENRKSGNRDLEGGE